MTYQSVPAGLTAVPARQVAQSGTLWKVFGLALIAVMVISAANLLDPVIRYDDYPALFADPEGFWSKTLSEGRWLNYVWHMREVVTPAWLNFAIYQAGWALFAAAFAVAVMPGKDRIWFACVLALTFLVAPPALLIAPWFNTLIPAMALLAGYAVLATRLSQYALRCLLPIFTLLTFLTYTTFPIILLLICLVRTERRSLKDLAGLITLFGTSFIASLLAVYALNWQVHGVFGLVLDASRSAVPAHDLSGVVGNLQLFSDTLAVFRQKMSFNSHAVMIFHLAMISAATLVIARRSPLEALYLHAGLWIGMALVTVQILKFGVTVPVRAYHFAWIAYAILILRACEELSRTPGLAGRMARNAVLLVTASYLLQVTIQFSAFRNWQAETRALAQDLATVPGPLFVTGILINHPSADKAGLQQPSALAGRIRQLTGRSVTLCETSPDACAHLPEELLNPGSSASPQIQIVQLDGASVIVFPSRE